MIESAGQRTKIRRKVQKIASVVGKLTQRGPASALTPAPGPRRRLASLRPRRYDCRHEPPTADLPGAASGGPSLLRRRLPEPVGAPGGLVRVRRPAARRGCGDDLGRRRAGPPPGRPRRGRQHRPRRGPDRLARRADPRLRPPGPRRANFADREPRRRRHTAARGQDPQLARGQPPRPGHGPRGRRRRRVPPQPASGAGRAGPGDRADAAAADAGGRGGGAPAAGTRSTWRG